MRRTNKLLKALKGWEFDVAALRESEGAFSSLDRRSPRAFSTNVSNETTIHTKNLCHYSGLRSTADYME